MQMCAHFHINIQHVCTLVISYASLFLMDSGTVCFYVLFGIQSSNLPIYIHIHNLHASFYCTQSRQVPSYQVLHAVYHRLWLSCMHIHSPITRVLLCSHSQFHAQGASSFTCFHKLPTIAPNPLRHTQVH